MKNDISWCSPRTEEGEKLLIGAYRVGLAIQDGSNSIADFEHEFGMLAGTAHVLGQSSGTAALHSAYFGAGFGPGDEVLVSSYGFHATVLPLLQLGAIPRFVDVGPDGIPLPKTVAESWNARTAGLVVTHLWGVAHNLDKLAELVKRLGGRLIEDCSHALGSANQGRRVGSWGFAAAASLHASKPIGVGEGGVMWTSDPHCYQRALVLGHGGKRAVREVDEPNLVDVASSGLGFKYRMAATAAALGLAGLRDLRNLQRRRADAVQSFLEELGPNCALRPAFSIEHINETTFHHVPMILPPSLRFIRPTLVSELIGCGLPIITTPSIKPYCEIPLLAGPSHAFPWLPEDWGCHRQDSPGALAYHDSLLLLSPEVLAEDPKEVAIECRRIVNNQFKQISK